MSSIFVQIASYRDPELIKTIDSLLNTAHHPENLRISICHQYHPDDTFEDIDKYRKDSRFQIDDVEYHRSKGVCWARNRIQEHYNGEEYTLQIDSHMRFIQGWDRKLISEIKKLQSSGIEKPLLTMYAPSYNPDIDPIGRVNQPWQMKFDRFSPDGVVLFRPEVIPEWQELEGPIPARFYSAHFCFTIGQFTQEIKHDPAFYFHGEEISITVRAFTHGYDLFHPHEVIAWHEYTRQGRSKQWDDDENWKLRNKHSLRLNRKLLGMEGEIDESTSSYILGNARSLEEYELYAGIIFSSRKVQDYTLNNEFPPNPLANQYDSISEWENSFKKVFKHCIHIKREHIENSSDYSRWEVSFYDSLDKVIHQQDALRAEINQLLNAHTKTIEIWREFEYDSPPTYWLVWPQSENREHTKIYGQIKDYLNLPENIPNF